MAAVSAYERCLAMGGVHWWWFDRINFFFKARYFKTGLSPFWFCMITYVGLSSVPVGMLEGGFAVPNEDGLLCSLEAIL